MDVGLMVTPAWEARQPLDRLGHATLVPVGLQAPR
jgi:hypothetical protein